MVMPFRVSFYKVFTMAFEHGKNALKLFSLVYVDLDNSFEIDWMSETAHDVFVVY